MKKIPLFKPWISKDDLKKVDKSLRSGWLTHGPNNLIFEKNFSNTVNSKYAVSMNSCTSALECALKLIKKKGEVIIPSWTWVSTANAVLNTGNVPVFADVNLNSRNITANEIKKSSCVSGPRDRSRWCASPRHRISHAECAVWLHVRRAFTFPGDCSRKYSAKIGKVLQLFLMFYLSQKFEL